MNNLINTDNNSNTKQLYNKDNNYNTDNNSTIPLNMRGT